MLGMNASQIDGDKLSGYNKAGLMGGAFVFTGFTDKWGAQMEIRYSAKGSATPKNDPFNRKYRLQYIEIPVLIKYRVIKVLEFQGGLSFGYLFNAGENQGDGYENFTEMLKPIEIAICAGINYSYFDPVNLNLRYSYSVLPIFENYTGASYGDGQAWYNNVITLGIYYRIGRESNY
jgi:hypothetical protein